jgi:hypothetical protein
MQTKDRVSGRWRLKGGEEKKQYPRKSIFQETQAHNCCDRSYNNGVDEPASNFHQEEALQLCWKLYVAYVKMSGTLVTHSH